MAGFYERRRLKMSWSQWCEMHDIPFTPALPGQPFEHVTRVPIGKSKRVQPRCQEDSSEYREEMRNSRPDGQTKGAGFKRSIPVDWRMMSKGFLDMPGGAEAAEAFKGENRHEMPVGTRADGSVVMALNPRACQEIEASLLIGTLNRWAAEYPLPPPRLNLSGIVHSPRYEPQVTSPRLPMVPLLNLSCSEDTTPNLGSFEQGIKYEEQN
jgi:hypothetical protein